MVCVLGGGGGEGVYVWVVVYIHVRVCEGGGLVVHDAVRWCMMQCVLCNCLYTPPQPKTHTNTYPSTHTNTHTPIHTQVVG